MITRSKSIPETFSATLFLVKIVRKRGITVAIFNGVFVGVGFRGGFLTTCFYRKAFPVIREPPIELPGAIFPIEETQKILCIGKDAGVLVDIEMLPLQYRNDRRGDGRPLENFLNSSPVPLLYSKPDLGTQKRGKTFPEEIY